MPGVYHWDKKDVMFRLSSLSEHTDSDQSETELNKSGLNW